MVWLHGGAFIFGAGGMSLYQGATMATGAAVVVSVNYRLAQLGFFTHPALEREQPNGPANFGLLDQIAALTWVQTNIAQFGGNSQNVTLVGQSAGARSVLALFASPLARGLFHKGIAQSPYAIPDAARSKALAAGIRVADAIGLKGAHATADELRAVPAERFGELEAVGLSVSPALISGDSVRPRSVQDTFAAGQQTPLPLIVGNTSNDSSVVAAFGVDPGDVIERLGAARILVRTLYPGVQDQDELGRQVARDLLFTMNARWIADRHASLAPTWRYYFDYLAVNERPRFPQGVGHGAEIAYVLNTVGVFEGTKDIVTIADREYARRVSEYWLTFAGAAAPSSTGSPSWPRHDDKQDRTMIFGNTMQVQTNFMRARLNGYIGVISILDRVLNRR